jgi:oligopeptide transport system substrate-binding protein
MPSATLRTVWREPPSMDPVLGGYNVTAPILTQLFSGLVAWGEDNEILPDVAHRWELAEGGRRYVFHLRDDVRWHDGVPVTAHDFAFTYRRAVEPATGAVVASSLLAPVLGTRRIQAGEDVPAAEFGVTAVDDHTLVIELEEPTSWFLANLGYYVLLPTPRHVIEGHGTDWSEAGTLVGNGPFRLAEWDHGQRMVLERNHTWHGSSNGNVGSIELDLATPDEDVGALYDADELDLVSMFTMPSKSLVPIIRRHSLDHHEYAAFITSYVGFDLTVPPLNDPRVRRALSMAIDRDALVAVVSDGLAAPAMGGIVPPGMPGHVPDLAPPHDPDEARRLLEEARAAGGDDVLLSTPPIAEVRARFLAQAWAEVGFPIRVEVVPLDEWQAGPRVITVGGWIADYADPDTFLRVMVDPPVPGWDRDGDYCHLLDEAARAGDQSARLQRYQQADRLLVEDAVVIPLLYQHWHVLFKPWVTNFRVPAVKHPGFWHELHVGPRPGDSHRNGPSHR